MKAIHATAGALRPGDRIVERRDGGVVERVVTVRTVAPCPADRHAVHVNAAPGRPGSECYSVLPPMEIRRG